MMANYFNNRLMLPLLLPLLALVAVSMSAASANRIGRPQSPLSTAWSSSSWTSSSVNLFRMYFEYVSAIWGEGIPALGVRPADPLYLDVDMVYTDANSTDFLNYTSIVVNTRGLTVQDFAGYQIDTADLDVDTMFSYMHLSKDHIGFVINRLDVTVVDADGSILTAKCTNMSFDVNDNQVSSAKELQVREGYLRVKQFNVKYSTDDVSASVDFNQCTGERLVITYMLFTVYDALSDYAFVGLQERLDRMSATVTTVLDDIFALRKITDDDYDDDDDNRVVVPSAGRVPEKHRFPARPATFDRQDGGQSVVRLSDSRASYSQLLKQQQRRSGGNVRMEVKWPTLVSHVIGEIK